MKKNGFTLVELLGVIVLIAIISSLAVISVSSVINSGKNGVYNNYEKTMEGAARNYFIENTSDLPSVGNSKTLTYSELLNNKFIDELKDPNGGNCSSSYVIIQRGSDKGINYNLTFKACVICSGGQVSYKTKDC